MQSSNSYRCVLGLSAVAALLAGCGGSHTLISEPSTMAQASERARELSQQTSAMTLPEKQQHHQTFRYTGARQLFRVPNGVTFIKIVALGAGGSKTSGRSTSGRGGACLRLFRCSRKSGCTFTSEGSVPRNRPAKEAVLTAVARAGHSAAMAGEARRTYERAETRLSIALLSPAAVAAGESVTVALVETAAEMSVGPAERHPTAMPAEVAAAEERRRAVVLAERAAGTSGDIPGSPAVMGVWALAVRAEREAPARRALPMGFPVAVEAVGITVAVAVAAVPAGRKVAQTEVEVEAGRPMPRRALRNIGFGEAGRQRRAMALSCLAGNGCVPADRKHRSTRQALWRRPK